MKLWYTAAELANETLPDFPNTQRGVTLKASREAWRKKDRQGYGGGWAYHVESLPAAAKAALIARQAPANDPAPAADLEAAQRWDEFERLPDSIKEKAQKRVAAVRVVKALADGGTPLLDAYRVAAAETGGSVGTVRRWWGLVKAAAPDAWLPILAPQYKGRAPSAGYDERAFEFFKSAYLQLSQPPAAECYRKLERLAHKEAWVIPSQDVLMRRLSREVPEPVQLLGRKGAKALHEMYPHQERDRSVFHALQGVNGDGHKLDVFAKWPNGTVSRPILVAWQDLYSGKWLAWRLAPSEDANTVRLSFGDLIEKWGIPEHVYVDNGRAFAAKQISGGTNNRYRFKIRDDEPEGMFTALGIRLHFVTPGAGQSKPIERGFGDVANAISKHPACDGAYCGNRPDAKPENYASRAIPIEDLDKLVDSEMAAINARSGRRSKICAGRSFNETFTESYAQSPIRRHASPAQRRLFLLRAEGLSTDRKSGAIKIAGNRYWSETLAAIPGARVVVRFDPERLHAPVHVYGLDGRYICQADIWEAAGFDDMAAAQDHARARSQFKRAHRDMLKAERRMTAAEVARLLPDAEAEETAPPNVIRPLFDQKIEEPDFDPEETDALFGKAMRRFTGGSE